MDQGRLLSDALSKSSSLLGGLLSQMNGVLGGGATQQGLFSSLLSQGNTLQSVLSAQRTIPQNSTAKIKEGQGAQTNPAPTLASVQQTTGAAPASATAATGHDTPSADTIVQKLATLSSTLHKIMDFLHQKNASADKGTGQKKTQDDAVSSVGSADNAADAKSADTASTDALTQDIVDIIAELLIMTQLVIANLQQLQKTGDTDIQTEGTPHDALASLAAAIKENAGEGKTEKTDIVSNSAEDILLPKVEIATAPFSATDDAFATDLATTLNATQAALTANPLLDMLQRLEKNIQKVLTDTMVGINDKKFTTPDAAVATTAQDTNAMLPVDLANQIAALDNSLKESIATLQQQDQTVPAAARQLTATAVQVESATSSTLLASVKQSAADRVGARTNEPPSTAASTQVSENENSPAAIATNTTTQSMLGRENTGHRESNPQAFADNHPFANPTPANNAATTPVGIAASGTYAFASTLSAIRATTGGTVGLPTVVDQVILQMNRNVKSGNDQMSLQLHPADMGKITVRLDFGSDGKVQGVVTADNPKTLDLLQKDSRSLERALQDAGLRADSGSLQFNLSGQSQQNAKQGEANSHGTQNALDKTGDTGEGLVDISTLAETYYITPNGVNIQV